MKKALLFSVCIMMFFPLVGAIVSWNSFVQDYYGYDDPGEASFHRPGYRYYYEGREFESQLAVADLGIQTTLSSNKKSFTLTGMEGSLLTVYCVWLQMDYGDLISYETMAGRSDYFMTYRPGDPGGVISNPITMSEAGTIYLAVMQDATFGGRQDSDPSNYYGWLELNVSETGDVTLVRDAFSLDGSPLFAGGGAAIPEPSSSILICMGVGILMLRRLKR